MRKKLIVSEVAKLLEISAHSIRYYDKEGLASSEYDSESGYRLFDMDDVARLSNIILLRESGIPIKKIKQLVGEYSTDSYKQQLELSLLQIEEKQRKLALQKTIVSNALKLVDDVKNLVEIKHYKKRFLKQLAVQSYEEEKTPVEMYEILRKEKIKNIMYRNLTYELRENDMLISFESEKETETFLESGDYLEYTFVYKTDEEIMEAVLKLIKEAEIRQLKLEEKIFLSMQPHAMLVVDYGYKATMYSRIVVIEGDY